MDHEGGEIEVAICTPFEDFPGFVNEEQIRSFDQSIMKAKRINLTFHEQRSRGDQVGEAISAYPKRMWINWILFLLAV